MDSYKVLKPLGKGAQGSVYLVDHLDGKRHVLKKVECSDESEANKAFKQAVTLKELEHPFICGYREFFVMWDSQETAMYLCVVSDHYKNGELGQYLKERREKKEAIKEEDIKRWLGEMLEALMFVHRHGIIHRDLKPSNVFLQDDMNIAIGDFGVGTIMLDVRTRTRSTVGCMNWMAPEVLDRPYDERSDLWSVGCITLELATCGFYDPVEMSGKLYEIKHNSKSLEDILSQVSQHYSEDLVSTIRSMLQKNFKLRPNITEIAEQEFVQECLTLSTAAMAEKRKKHSKRSPQRPIAHDGSIDEVLKDLKKNIHYPDHVKGALEYIRELTSDGCSMFADGVLIIVEAMSENLLYDGIQMLGCMILNNVIVNSSLDSELLSKGVVPAVTVAMKEHPDCLELQLAALSFLTAVSGENDISEKIGSLGGIEAVLDSIKKFPGDVSVIVAAFNALWNLCINESNCQIVTEQKGLITVCDAMRTHFNHPDVIASGAATLIASSNSPTQSREWKNWMFSSSIA